jgi:hypothetical protein
LTSRLVVRALAFACILSVAGCLSWKIGKANARSLDDLKHCRQEAALAEAEIGIGSENPRHQLAGYEMKALVLKDMGRDREARAVYDTILEHPEYDREGTAESLDAEANEELRKVRKYRRERNARPVCR